MSFNSPVFSRLKYISTVGRMLSLNLCEGGIAYCPSTLNVMFLKWVSKLFNYTNLVNMTQ
jgi:hypothetical protein